MKDIYLVKQLNGSLLPAYDSDKELMSSIKVGEIYKYKFSKPRNIKFLRKFFALIKLVYENQEHYRSIEHLRRDLTIESGYYDVRVNKFTGEQIIEPKSISFASMDEIEFGKLYSKFLVTVIRVFGWDGEEIENNIADFI